MATLVHYRKRDGEFETARIEAKESFLKNIADGYSVAYSAKKAGIHRNTPYAWADEDPDFAYSWESSKQSGGDWYEDVLRNQAEKGNPTSTIVGLKMHKRFVEDRYQPQGGDTYNITLTTVTNQLSLIIGEAEATFPGIARWMGERLKALEEGKG